MIMVVVDHLLSKLRNFSSKEMVGEVSIEDLDPDFSICHSTGLQ